LRFTFLIISDATRCSRCRMRDLLRKPCASSSFGTWWSVSAAIALWISLV